MKDKEEYKEPECLSDILMNNDDWLNDKEKLEICMNLISSLEYDDFIGVETDELENVLDK